jgi:hypothetical protein
MAAICLTTTLVQGQELSEVVEEKSIYRVTETWELIVGSADPAEGAPQLNTVMSPLPHVDSYYGLVTVNYSDLPSVVLGGLQSQIWHGETNLTYGSVEKEGTTISGPDTITWSQYMEIKDGKLDFHVHDGTSTTWGSWGGGGFCSTGVSTDLANMNGYTPAISVEYTRRWGFERDRIISLKITSITKDYTDGTTSITTTPIVVLPIP